MLKYRLFLLFWVLVWGWVAFRCFQVLPYKTPGVLCTISVSLAMVAFAITFHKSMKHHFD